MTKKSDSHVTHGGKNKAPCKPWAASSAPPISPREAGARAERDTFARRKGKEPVIADARARQSQQLQRPNAGSCFVFDAGTPTSPKRPSDGNNAATTTTTNKSKRPLAQTFTQAHLEAQAERRKLDGAKLLTAALADPANNTDNRAADSKTTVSAQPKTPELFFFAHWPPPSRERPSREEITGNLRSAPPPSRQADDDVPDHDLEDDQWRKSETDLDSATFARNLANFGEPKARIPGFGTLKALIEQRTEGDSVGVAQLYRERMGPPKPNRCAEDHTSFVLMSGLYPNRRAVAPDVPRRRVRARGRTRNVRQATFNVPALTGAPVTASAAAGVVSAAEAAGNGADAACAAALAAAPPAASAQ